MQNAFTLGKRGLTIAIVATTILWSVGIASFIAPAAANAATTSDGDLVKGSLSTVYYVWNGERYTFPNSTTYFTWYEDFSSVKEISDSDLADLPLAGNVVMRPGTWMLKIDTDPKTYVVTRDGVIRWVETEDVATDLYGANWNQWVVDVPDVFFVDYSQGASMTSAELVDGMLVSGSTYLIWDGEKRMVDSAGMSGNRFQDRFIITDSSVALGDYAAGDDITGEIGEISDTSQNSTSSGVVTTGEGTLTISLSDSSPASQTIPEKATSVDFMGIDLEATGGDVTLNGLVLDFEGVADLDVFERVYLYQNGTRLTTGKTVNTTTREVTFSGLNVDVANGATETLMVVIDVDDDDAFNGANDVAFAVNEAGVTSTADTLAGDFPVMGATHTITDAATVGTVTINDSGTPGEVTIGEKEAEIARFTLATATEDGVLTSILLNTDDAKNNTDYQLWQGSTLLADGVNTTGDLVLYELDSPYTISKGKTKTLSVTATIGGDPSDTIATALEENGDMRMLGGTYGFPMLVSNSYGTKGTASCTGTDCTEVTVRGGKLTFAFNGPTATDIQVGGTDVPLFDFTLTSQNWSQVNAIDFTITGDDLCNGTTGANYQSFEIQKADGSVLMGPNEFDTPCSSTDANAKALSFTDSFTMEAGDSMDLTLVMDVADDQNAGTGETIYANLEMPQVEAEDVDGNSLTSGTDIIPSADLTGHTMTNQTASLTIDLAATPVAGTVVKGSSDVDMVGFTFTAGQASDVTTTAVDFSVLVDTTGPTTWVASGGDFEPEDKITSCSIYDGDGALIDGPEAIESDGTFDFTGFNWTTPAGETASLVVNCDFANADTDTSNDDYYAVEILLAADVTTEDEDGNEITPTLSDGNTGETIYQTVTQTGALDVNLASDSPDSTIIIGSSTGVEVGKYRFSATTEAAKVTDLNFDNSGTGAVSTAIDISYTNSNGDTETKSGVLASNTVTFSGLDMYVPQDGTADVTVTVDTNSVSATGATSGNTIDIDLDESAVEWVGVGSGESTVGTSATSDPSADTFYIRKTKPTMSLASGSPSGSDVPGDSEVLRFNIAADSHGYVTVDEITFEVASTDNNGLVSSTADWNECISTASTSGLLDPADFDIYNVDDLSTTLDAAADWTLLENTSTACTSSSTDDQVLSYAVLDLTTPVEIAAGSTETFVVYVDTTGASSANDDTFRLSIPIDSDVATLVSTDPDGALIWDDDNTAVTSGTNIDATRVKTLPVRGGTLVY